MDFFLVERGGGILNSLHISEQLFLLLPFITEKWLIISTIAFLLMQVSKSTLLTLLLYGIIWSFTVSSRQTIKTLLILFSLLLLFSPLLINVKMPYYGTEGFQYSFGDFFISRVGSSVKQFVEKAIKSDRIELIKIAIDSAKNTMFLGAGLGSSTFELEKRQAITTSNYHNLYFTLLAEGGLLFLFGFISFSIYLLRISYKIDKKVFVGLVCWLFYGGITGWLYAGGSCIDYYMLMFVAAYLSYKKKKKRKLLNPSNDLKIS